MSTTIYYYSATGNSYDVARELSEKLGNTELQSLVPLAARSTIACAGTIGLVFPVYDWTIPLVVKEFLLHLDISQVKYVFAVVTCNYLPGCSLDTVKSILAEKSLKLNAGFVVKMPGTYLPMYGANSPRTQAGKFRRKSSKTSFIADIVRSGRDRKIEHSPIGIDRLLGPSMAKNIDTFPAKDNAFVVEPDCTGCGICTKVCPFDNIVMSNGKPEWQHKCQQCFACVHLCPNSCIQIGDKTKDKKRYKNPNVPLNEIIRIASDRYSYP